MGEVQSLVGGRTGPMNEAVKGETEAPRAPVVSTISLRCDIGESQASLQGNPYNKGLAVCTKLKRQSSGEYKGQVPYISGGIMVKMLLDSKKSGSEVLKNITKSIIQNNLTLFKGR